jgi:hypothetical protein
MGFFFDYTVSITKGFGAPIFMIFLLLCSVPIYHIKTLLPFGNYGDDSSLFVFTFFPSRP